MPVKIYISGISGNKEVKKRQQRVLMILDSKGVEYEVIDITEPGKEDDKEFMQTNSTTKDDSKYPLPPQIFNEEDYCGDYEDFDLSNEIDELEKFLKLVPSSKAESRKNSVQSNNVQHNGDASSREASTDKETSVAHSDGDLDERPSETTVEKEEEEEPTATKSENVTRETADELDTETLDEVADRNEEKSDDQEQEE